MDSVANANRVSTVIERIDHDDPRPLRDRFGLGLGLGNRHGPRGYFDSAASSLVTRFERSFPVRSASASRSCAM